MIGLMERFWNLLAPADVSDVVKKAASEHKAASDHAEEVAKLNHAANGRLRDAVRKVRSTAFADFETAVKHRD